jgi:adenine-specific DNA-methyltransferase
LRYIGNKTRLIPFLLEAVERIGGPPGVACDPFAGTASVARALKARGWRVHAGDLMASSYALQVARVELDRTPRFPADLIAVEGNGRASVSYSELLEQLEQVPVSGGFLTEHFTPAGKAGAAHGRMYFTPENARRIDTVRETIREWSEADLVDRQREQLLVATLIEAADRVANTTGVYASFVKSWQPNAGRPLELRPLRPVSTTTGRGSTAFKGSAEELARRVGALDLAYLDPPYNERQYPAYYHLPELLAQGWNPPPPLRGKTGLIPDEDRRSEWCRRARCESALRGLLGDLDARHILLSYNDEGLLSVEQIESALREAGDPDSYQCFQQEYQRYRSDGDHAGRRYTRNSVHERLHYVRRA